VLPLSGSKGKQLLAKIDALLTGKVRLFHVAAGAVDTVTGRAHRDDRGRAPGLSGRLLHAHEQARESSGHDDKATGEAWTVRRHPHGLNGVILLRATPEWTVSVHLVALCSSMRAASLRRFVSSFTSVLLIQINGSRVRNP
jgi:hypothetical protein